MAYICRYFVFTVAFLELLVVMVSFLPSMKFPLIYVSPWIVKWPGNYFGTIP